MRASAARVLVLGVLVVLGTAIAGWWSVALIGALWGLVAAPATRPALAAAAGAGLAWGMLLGWAALRGPVGRVAELTASVVGASAWVMLAATIAFPMMLAMAAATVAGTVRRSS